MAKKIGILTCSNTTGDTGCPSMLCLHDIHEGEGTFAAYADDGGAQLAGIISCAGCPTAVAPEKLLRRVRSLAAAGAEAIHMANCMMALCPFKKKYKSLLEANFPDLDIVEGTHAEPEGASPEMFVDGVHHMLTQPQVTMADLAGKAKAEGIVP